MIRITILALRPIKKIYKKHETLVPLRDIYVGKNKWGINYQILIQIIYIDVESCFKINYLNKKKSMSF